jgi:hypothetical protein
MGTLETAVSRISEIKELASLSLDAVEKQIEIALVVRGLLEPLPRLFELQGDSDALDRAVGLRVDWYNGVLPLARRISELQNDGSVPINAKRFWAAYENGPVPGMTLSRLFEANRRAEAGTSISIDDLDDELRPAV